MSASRLAAALFLTALAPASAQTNLGFESPLSTGWTVGGSGTAEVDSAIVSDGMRSLRLTPRGQNASVAQRVPADSLDPARGTPAAATRVRLRGQVRTEALVGGASLWLRVDGDDGVLAFDNRGRGRVSGTTGWTQVEITLVLPPEATRVVFGALAMGTGAAWADSLALDVLAPSGSTSPEATAYLGQVLTLARTRALRRDSVDWPRLEATATGLLRGAQTTQDTYPVVRYVLTALGDRHSQLMEAQEASAMDEPDAGDLPAGMLGQLSGGRSVGMIWMPGFTGGGAAGQTFADALQDVIHDLDEAAPCAYIVDLRGNTGGNVFPMLAGIRPVLGEAFAGASAPPGGPLEQVRYDDPDNPFAVSATHPVVLRTPDPPVAVLTSAQTASSGEWIAVAFRGRPQTRSFGAPTEGLTTGNADHALGDGAVLFLTETVYVDRDGTRYGGPLVPDEVVEDDPTGATDPVLGAALAWLGTVCRP